MANVHDVADFFIELARQSEHDDITPLKLNKLLYYAQGLYLAKTGTPLFDEPIEAWNLGPVVPVIYHKYKACGRNPIESDETDVAELFTDDEYSTLLDTAREYGIYSASYLVDKTHTETPWLSTQRNSVIDNALIAEYFSNLKPVCFEEIISNIPSIGRRDSDGYFVLPTNEKDEYWDEQYGT